MAGTLKIVSFDSDVRILYSVALGLTNNVKGMHFDGYYFWVADTTDVYQVLIDGTSARIVRSFNVSGVLPGTTPTITAMTGNEHYLWIAYTHTTTQYEVAQFSKDGNYLFRLTGFDVNSAVGSEWRDLALMGEHYLWSQRDTGALASDDGLFQCDLSTGSNVFKLILRSNWLGFSFIGNDVAVGVDSAGKLTIKDVLMKSMFQAPTVISTLTEGLDIISRKHLGSALQFDVPNIIGDIDAHLVALVHN